MVKQSHKIITSDAEKALAKMPANCVHCVVTSPPYWNLRDYKSEGQIGAERSPAVYVSRMTTVFAAVRRVLRPDGTVWLNMGDSSHRGQLAGVPWRLAFALQADGWLLQREIIWHKPNPMPGNGSKGPSVAHETVFLFSRARAYYYDGYAVRVPGTYTETRDLRTVWTIPVGRYKGAHFAVFPDAIPTAAIAAGTSEGGACGACGAPYARQVKRTRVPTRPGRDVKADDTKKANRDPQRHVTTVDSLGFTRSCECVNATAVPCVVLDPFAGAGTTNAVAASMGRSSIGIEINPATATLARERIRDA